MKPEPPLLLSIAGSDCSSGAGIQADLKTFHSLGGYGLTVLTCVVAEVPGKVVSFQALEPSLVQDQLEVLLKNYPVAAIKTGMLSSSAIIERVAEVLGNLEKPIPLVIDPVMIASSGDALLALDAVEKYFSHLFPLATLITPNLDELTFLAKASKTPSSFKEMQELGHALRKIIGKPLLLKGGHLHSEEAIDLLVMPEGEEEIFLAKRLEEGETHGSGCTYSAAITAALGQGYPLVPAISLAKKFITQAIAQAHRWGSLRALRQVLDPNDLGINSREGGHKLL